MSWCCASLVYIFAAWSVAVALGRGWAAALEQVGWKQSEVAEGGGWRTKVSQVRLVKVVRRLCWTGQRGASLIRQKWKELERKHSHTWCYWWKPQCEVGLFHATRWATCMFDADAVFRRLQPWSSLTVYGPHLTHLKWMESPFNLK